MISSQPRRRAFLPVALLIGLVAAGAGLAALRGPRNFTVIVLPDTQY